MPKKRANSEVKLPARPFVKWAGGKNQLLGELRLRIPKSWDPKKDLYAELFLGGGALYYALAPARALLNDANEELVGCWRSVRDGAEQVAKVLRSLQGRYRLDPEKVFYEVRGWDPASLDEASRAARMIFLNKTCFNGVYRVNSSGIFNTPWCKNPKATIVDEENLLACSERMRSSDLQLTSLDFEKVEVPPGTLVYLDPPYVGISMTSNFVRFTALGFGESDQRRLANYAKKLVEKDCRVIVSHSCDEKTADLYRDRGFKCDYVRAVRRINAMSYGRGPVGEYILYAG
jgi:DNA adenine methylase